jgi:uncharacterized protein (UPF0264 family)
MQVLISPISVEEARSVCAGGADIVDIKNVKEGSLGANFPWVIRDIITSLKDQKVAFSATLGDLPNKPGTAALAAAGAATTGVNYIKAGLFGVRDYDEALPLMKAVTRACRETAPEVYVVAAGYADYRRFDGLPCLELIRVARDAGADFVMVDTAIKDGKTLFDSLSFSELRDFTGGAREAGLKVALAGSIRFEHLSELQQLDVDLIGVRGCVCRSADRNTVIDPSLVRRFVQSARAVVAASSYA